MNLRKLWPFSRSQVDKSIHDVGWGSSEGEVTAETVSVRAAAAQSKNLTPSEQYELSIAVRAAVGAISQNTGKMVIRLFTRSGREITGGALFDLLRMPCYGYSQSRLLQEISSWYNIAGEFFLDIQFRDGLPAELIPLAPTHMSVHTPERVNTRRDVIQWRYRWTDGSTQYIRDDHVIFERMFNPNARSIRGLSPLVTGGVQVSGAYYAERYNKNFFENSAVPSHVLVLPDGTPKIERDRFTRQYLQSYGAAYSGAHKVAVVSATKDFKIEHLEQPFQDGAFMEMMKRGDLKVGQLYRVPAINMGIYDKTRFDTANEERKLFLEETLEPQAQTITEALQHQLVDPFFQNTPYTTSSREVKNFGRDVRKSFEKAESERRGGIIVLLDTDALPIKHEVQLAKTENALKLRETYDLSARKVEEYIGMDFDDDRPERDEIFIPNNRVCITDPKLNESLVPGVKPGGEEETPAKPKPADPAKVEAAKKFLRKVRRPTLDAVDAGGMWSLEAGYKLAGDETLNPMVRRLRHDLRKLGGDKDAIKDYLNHADPKRYLHA